MVQERLATFSGPKILDLGCGTAQSTFRLATEFPEHLVVGIDKSEKRLAKAVTPATPDHSLVHRVLLLRADASAFWRLLKQDRVTFAHTTLFYPSPWPKKAHLARRWYAHPAFASLISITQTLECRSNDENYLREMSLTLKHLFQIEATITSIHPTSYISAFEEKFSLQGVPLFSLHASCINWATNAGDDSLDRKGDDDSASALLRSH